ncbi:MAG: class I SAM-dependent methyltransferase [Thermodesulfovibrionales bacterium]
MDHFNNTRRLYLDTVKPITRYSRRRRIDILLDYVVGKRVLDLGCVEHESSIEEKNDWWLHGLIKHKAASVLGVDYDSMAINELKARGYNVCVADVETMDLHDKYDVVIAGEVFEHLTNHRSFLDSVRRHLAPDGIFVASMPNANSLNYFMQTLIFGHEVDAWDHASFFTPVTLTVLLKKCGFVPTEIILYQPDEIFHHENKIHRVIAYIFNRLQQIICWARHSLARGLIVVAKNVRD